MTIVFPGLRCDMEIVVASIGWEGLLGTEALLSCLPHQLDLRTGQLWADGQSTPQLHQQRQVVRASAHIKGSLVMPPDSETVAPVSIRSPSGIPPWRCSLIESELDITEINGVLVGRTLVDASDWSASVLLINLGSDMVVLPSFSCVSNLVPVSAVLVTQTVAVTQESNWPLPEHLEDIITGSHPSLGDEGRDTLWNILHRYTHVFPAPGEMVTGRTTAVQHDIEHNGARPVRCGPRRLAPAGL